MVEGIKKEGGRVLNISANNNWQIIRKAGEVVRFVQENNIDLIHCHLPWAGFLGRRVYKKTGIPVLYTEHNKQERYHVATRLLNKLSFNTQTAAIAVSGDVAASIHSNIRPHIPVHTVLNGIDTEKFIRDEQAGREIRNQYNIPAGATVLGNIAVFRAQKRLKEWVDLFACLHRENSAIYGILVGAGPMMQEVKNHITALGLQHQIILPGLQTDVLPWLSAIDVYLTTSEFEGLPIALLEAMSMKCAVVSTEAGGISELIRNGQDGFTCPVYNWVELKKPLQQLIDNPADCRKWGEAARQRVNNNFSIKKMVEQLESVYSSILTQLSDGNTRG